MLNNKKNHKFDSKLVVIFKFPYFSKTLKFINAIYFNCFIYFKHFFGKCIIKSGLE